MKVMNSLLVGERFDLHNPSACQLDHCHGNSTMNSACPSCGAVYAVTTKDIGRKLKCKKCAAALAVTDAGLVTDTSMAPVVSGVAIEDAGDDVFAPKSKKSRRYSGPSGPGVGELVSKVGGVPTVLFALGTFLVIWFTFMTPIGEAATARAEAAVGKLLLEQKIEVNKLLPKGKKNVTELNEEERKKHDDEAKKINERYEKLVETAREDSQSTQINNVRSVWFDKYGQLFGFVLLAFGCIGYVRTEQPLTMQIVAAVVLGLMLLMIFSLAVGGCGGGSRPAMPKFGG